MWKYSFFVLIALVGTTGQILFKLGVNQVSPLLPKTSSSLIPTKAIFVLLSNYLILSAILLYGIGVFIWLFTLMNFELSFAFPITAIVFVSVIFFSWILLNEHISLLRITGTFLITIGVIIIFFTK